MTGKPDRRTFLRGAVGTATAGGLLAAGGRAEAAPGPSLTALGSSLLDRTALYFVSYDGLVNNNAFQKNALLTYRDYQYAVWYAGDRNATVARRPLGATAWSTATVGHRLSTDDSHNVVCAGVSPADGRLHLVMDAHSSGYTYVKSVAGLLDAPASQPWTADRFGAPQTSLDGVRLTTAFTYPQFLVSPSGALQLSYRRGVSGNGEAALAEYADGRWRDLGAWSSAAGTYTTAHGSSAARSLYLHGLDYGRDGVLHVFGTWREQSAAVTCGADLTNHDTVYVRSADRGRTWLNAAGAAVGTTGGSPVSVSSPGLVVDPLSPDHALMNQESQGVDSAGRPHALISYVPGRFGQCVPGYVAGRIAYARPFHVWRDSAGAWHKTELPFPLESSQRSQLAFDAYDNAYAVLPYGRIAAASAAGSWSDWTMLYDGRSALNAFGEVVIDQTRLAADGVLSILYQERSSGTTPSALHVLDFALPR
ncbi:BNR repeat-containing protein [Streptomyces hoynatensis]|uniref:Tat pathway signal sequence domain protein n=1 Tax=Streptomyces hoynatensis TaxID=1141874 RepID=A0A3A9YCK5_9ACTN|nr:BNR repeat-containing protein [Streptomyces hoynatensis]RKN34970.1 Tat pathway signal sequence domain protein [Streptomyces hoynatensis]